MTSKSWCWKVELSPKWFAWILHVIIWDSGNSVPLIMSFFSCYIFFFHFLFRQKFLNFSMDFSLLRQKLAIKFSLLWTRPWESKNWGFSDTVHTFFNYVCTLERQYCISQEDLQDTFSMFTLTYQVGNSKEKFCPQDLIFLSRGLTIYQNIK